MALDPDNPISPQSVGPSSRLEWEVLTAGGYKWLRQLGRGQYGTVHLVERQDGGNDGHSQAVAKVVFLDHLKDRDRNLAHQEVELLKRLCHPNIVRHHDSWLHRSTPGMKGESSIRQEALVTVMEHCDGGDLRQWLDDWVSRQEFMPEQMVLRLFVQMVEGIQYVHERKILHRDLKTSNMLLTRDKRVVKIGDFGIARVLDNQASVAVTMLGTPYYMSPEICKGEPYRDKSDMWSLGCVLYEMCVLRHAFESQSLLGLVYCIVSETNDPIPADRYSAAVADVVAQLLTKNADQRLSAQAVMALEVLQPYFKGGPLAVDHEAPTVVKPSVPPPPPQVPADCMAPLPPPSPKGISDTSEGVPPPPPKTQDTNAFPPRSAGSTLNPSDTQVTPPFPSAYNSNASHGEAMLSSLPPLHRPAPPPGSPSPGRRSSGVAPTGGVAGCPAPPRTAKVCEGAPGAFPAPRAAFPLQNAGHGPQVLLSRARSALLRRPKQGGNWVQAFAKHDVSGCGLLGRTQFEAFLESLAIGFSTREIRIVADAIVGTDPASEGGVSLGTFSDAITQAVPTEQQFGEQWALNMVDGLLGSAPGLGIFDGQGEEVLSGLPQPTKDLGTNRQGQIERLLLWLPKTPHGAVDWNVAEEWRAGGLHPWGR